MTTRKVLTFNNRGFHGGKNRPERPSAEGSPWRRDAASRAMHFLPRVVVAAGGGLIIRVSPYFWKWPADGAQCGPSRGTAETAFPGFSRAWSISNHAYLAVVPQVLYKATLRIPISSKIALALAVSQHPFAHEAGARISKERDGSDRCSARLDIFTASSPLFV